LVTRDYSVSCIGIIGIHDDYYEYELYQYGSEIIDTYRSLYYSTEKNSITAYDPNDLSVKFKFIFETRGRDTNISFAYIDIHEISDDSPIYIHKSADLEICPRKFVVAWNDITDVDGTNYLYKCEENSLTYKYKYAEDNIHLDELICLTGQNAELLI
jgi:hypothetical protein